MTSPSYSSNIDDFLTKYNNFNDFLNEYTTLLDEFNEQVNTLLQHASGSNVTEQITRDSRNYLKTKNGLLIAMNSTHGESDFSANKLNVIGGIKYFYVDPNDMSANNYNFGDSGYKDSSIIQGGLNNLKLTYTNKPENRIEITDTNNIKLIPRTEGIDKIDALSNYSVNERRGCDINDVQFCASYAKMNDKRYFGLRDDSTKCLCYTFDNINGYDDNTINISSNAI